MPATVVVNHLSVVHAASGGISSAFPDVCKTPAPPAPPIPIPYPNIAMSSDTAQGSKKVKADGNPLMLKGSNFAMSTGDEAGSLNGVVSNKIKGKAYPKMYSFDVKVEGDNVFRFSDIMLQNGGSPTNTPPASEIQANIPGGVCAPGEDPEKVTITEMKWSKGEVCCGDEVHLKVKAENMDGTSSLPVIVERTQDKRMVGNLSLSGGSTMSTPWVVRRGPYRDDASIAAYQSMYGGEGKTASALKVKTAPETKQKVGPMNVYTPKYVLKVDKNTGNKQWKPNGEKYRLEVCYEAVIDHGQLWIIRKVDFQRKGFVGSSVRGRPTERQKRKWKWEIERIWDRKFKIHRKECKRGKKCDCLVSINSHEGIKTGCCMYAIRVRVRWGSGHGSKVTLNQGKNDPKDWGGPKWWYSHTWWEGLAGVPSTVRAHEFGHLIGMYDEYQAGAVDPARAYANVPDSVMSSGSNVYERHYEPFHKWFAGKAEGTIGKTELLRV